MSRLIDQFKVADLKKGSIRDQTFSDGFIQSVKDFKQVLAEVEKVSLESTLQNFQRDLNPEKELKLWEYMASVYRWFIAKNAGLSISQKKEVFSIILCLSSGMKEFNHIKTLTKEMVDEIANRY